MGEDGIAVLDFRGLQPVAKFAFADLVTFGGCQDDFMLVATAGQEGGTTRMLFQMRKPEILAITLLIADYMNAIGRMNPGLLQAPATPKMSSAMSRGSARSSSRNCAPTPSSSVASTPRLVARNEVISSNSGVIPDKTSMNKKRPQLDSGVGGIK